MAPPPSPPTVNVEVDSRGFAVIRLVRKPVNSLDASFLQELTRTLHSLERDSSIKGMILTSGLSNSIFCAGLDLTELHGSTRERFGVFWTALQQLFLALYCTSLITVAAINGACPAAGCLLALCCDVRVMTKGPFKIGLNETLLGLVAPWWFCELMMSAVGTRHADRLLQLGWLCDCEEALRIGLVDALATEADLMKSAETHLLRWMRVPNRARQLTKSFLRAPLAEKLRSCQQQDVEDTWRVVNDETTQRQLGAYLKNLKSKM